MLDKKIIDFDRLSIYHEKINEVFKTKQDVISDLDDIRSGAELGSTALQDIPDRSITFDKLDQDVLDELYGCNGGTGTYPEINHGTSDTTFTLTPNTLHVWDEVDSLTLTLGEKTTGVANEYLFQFTSGSEPTVLTLPDSIIWANNEILEIESNRIYQISILNNIATFITAESQKKPIISLEYFTIKALEDGLTAKLSINACEYRVDNGDWTTLAADTDTIAINTGQTLSFKGNLTPTSSNGIGTFTISKKCNVKGNIMSLLYGDDFIGKTDLTGYAYAFRNLFFDSSTLIDAGNLILPATILDDCCYRSIFNNCTSLIQAPELPATTLADYCYQYMFYNCNSLTTAPELPATTLAESCYYYMFYKCTSLTTAPELPATTLAPSCYTHMFEYCASLTTVPELPVTTLTERCYNYMFSGCTSLTTAPELPATTLTEGCYFYMFYGCTSLTTAPELPATTLAERCYCGMFYGCTSLTTAPELPATTLATECYNSMFEYCTSLTTVPELPATTLARECYDSMFNRCTSLTTAPELPATTLATGCYDSMFNRCTSLTTAPELPATTLAESCYDSMFQGCSNLNNITMLATDITANICLYYWVDGVSSTGTFIKHSNMNSLSTGPSGIPSGWEVKNYGSLNKISFSIDYVQYQAEEGMTWEEWVNSDYNTSGFYIGDLANYNNVVICPEGNNLISTTNSSPSEKNTTVIISNKNYGYLWTDEMD